MREATRRLLLRGGALAIVAVAVGLIALRSGRPLFYTDGERQIVARDLADASMLVWDPPTVECELPGPVLGRVQEMPDGRLLYGRATPDGSSDLVLWDPARPAAEPQPVAMLNSPAHELAPALATDGVLYFASDRAGGAGGYDLYRARVGNGGFGPAQRLPETINSALDETDPAPHPTADTLVFVRRDPEIEQGRNGALLITDRGGVQQPQPLDTAGEVLGALCRDPVFSPDGVSLWFVRQEGEGPPLLMRMWRHGDTFAAAVPAQQLSERGPFRAPAPFVDGFALRLLKQLPDQPTLLYTARAREVYPWWAGQAWLELILFGVLVALLVIELLLLLGRRWRQLDFVTWCILASLLVHILLLLWMTDVELVRRFVPPAPQEGMLEVTLLSADGSDGGDGAEPGQAMHDPSQELQFTGHVRDLSASAPGGDLAAASASLMAAGERAVEVAPDAEVTEVDAGLQDAAAAPERRSGVDGETTVAAHAVPVEQDASRRVEAARSLPPGAAAIVVRAPGADTRAMQVSRPLAPAAHAAMALPEAGAFAPAPPDVADARAAEPVHVAADGAENSDAAIEPRVSALTDARRGAPLPARSQTPPPAVGGGGSAPQPDTATLPTARPRPAVAGPARPADLPIARRLASAPALQDAASPPPPASPGVATVATPAAVQPLVASTPEPRTPAVVPLPRRDTDPAPRVASSDLAASAPPTFDLRASTRVVRPGTRMTASREPRGLVAGASPLRDAPVAAVADAAPRVRPDSAPGVALQPLALALAPATTTLAAPRREPRPAPRAGAVQSGIQVPGSLLTRAPPRLATQSRTPPPAASLFANRVGARKTEALEKFGGNEETERAVQRGLAYLAGIQARGGGWGSKRRSQEKYGQTTVGKTALCVLAFLGAGHTPQSQTEYSGNVDRAVQFLLDEQDIDTGHFGYTSAYSHGISTYALAECYGMIADGELRQRLRKPVERAVDWIVSNQNRSGDRRSRGGWGYFSPFLEPEDDFARTSVSAWMVMALESAKLSGFEVPERSLSRAREFLLQCWDSRNGYFLYNREPGRLSTSWRTLPASTPAALFVLQLLGEDPDDSRMRAGFDYTLARKPTAYRRYDEDAFVQRAAGNVYFWYYGSLATFLAGGRLWDEWNAALKKVLPAGQEPDGSWPAIGPYARYAGDTRSDRSYSTAMCVLSLEVYYRYFTPLLRGK